MQAQIREELEAAIDAAKREFAGQFAPIAVVTGSGLGALAQLGREIASLPFNEIPGLGASTVAGHGGRLLLLDCESVKVFCVVGRRHIYEGIEPSLAAYMIRLLAGLGVRNVILSNAAGGLTRRFFPGDLMLITDHINLMFRNPLIGGYTPEDGPRFPDMSEPYDPELCACLKAAAREEKVELKDGTYLALTGPSYETRAEVTAWQRIGADAVGMSTVPEVLIARQAGLRVAAISLITNSHVHPAAPPTHEEVLEMGQLASDKLRRIIARSLKNQEQ